MGVKRHVFGDARKVVTRFFLTGDRATAMQQALQVIGCQYDTVACRSDRPWGRADSAQKRKYCSDLRSVERERRRRHRRSHSVLELVLASLYFVTSYTNFGFLGTVPDGTLHVGGSTRMGQ